MVMDLLQKLNFSILLRKANLFSILISGTINAVYLKNADKNVGYIRIENVSSPLKVVEGREKATR